MSRLSSQTKFLSRASVVGGVAHLFEAHFDGGVVRLTNAAHSVVLERGGQREEYQSVGALGSVSAVEEGSELQRYGVSVSLSGISPSLLSLALREPYQGRRASLYLVFLESNQQVLNDPVHLFSGRIDSMHWTWGEQARIVLTMLNPLAEWERTRLKRYTDNEQRTLYSDDHFFEFLTALAERPIYWGSYA